MEMSGAATLVRREDMNLGANAVDADLAAFRRRGRLYASRLEIPVHRRRRPVRIRQRDVRIRPHQIERVAGEAGSFVFLAPAEDMQRQSVFVAPSDEIRARRAIDMDLP